MPSSKKVWPTKDKPSLYSLNAVVLNLSQHKIEIERQTYSLLEWIGDIGGLFDGLRIVASSIVTPLAAFVLKSKLLSENFSLVKSKIPVSL